MLKAIRQTSLLSAAFAAGLLLFALLLSLRGLALTDSGTTILNQASATFIDLDGVERAVTSNQVQTVIRQVGGIDLVSSQSKPSVPNGRVLFPHVLTNTGNGPDTYEICIGNTAGSFSFSSIAIYEDLDENGLPDASTQMVDGDLDGCYDVGSLAAGGTFGFVIVAETPDIVATNQTSQFQVDAISDFDLTLTESNTDIVTLIDGPLIEVVKSLSHYRGFSGTAGYSVVLEYRNVGTEAATDLIITDVLPTSAASGETGSNSLGMVYTSGSAEWQQGTALDLTESNIDPLTDAGDSDIQTDAGVGLIYCAYDASCLTAPFGANQVSVQIDTVPVGAIGSITFDFSVDDGYEDNEVLKNFASFEYRNAADTLSFGTYVSNTVNFVITDEVEDPSVVANDSDGNIATGVLDSSDTGNIVSLSVAQSQPALFSNYIWNSASAGFDTFDITLDTLNDREGNPLVNAFPTGTNFTLLKEDGRTPLLDTNGNGIPDTGPLDAGQYLEVVLRVQMPADVFGNNGGNGWEVTKIATSVTDSSVYNSVTDRLLSVSESTVDLTNDAAGVAGAGIGAEASPVTTLVIDPGSFGVFQLWVENTSSEPDSYVLEFSDQNFSSGSLPTGWELVLQEDDGSLDCSSPTSSITGAFTLLPANKKLVCAVVFIAEGTQGSVATDLYFRVRSDTTGALDIKRDAVTVSALPELQIVAAQSGQGEPGSTITYPHTISNTGNVDLECVNLNMTDSLASNGWTSTAYLDVDASGTLSAGDTLLTDQSLSVGASLRIILRVAIPTQASYGFTNLTDIVAQGYPAGSGCSSGLLTDSVADSTLVTNTDMVINKTQAIDADCNGVADGVALNTDPAAPFGLSSFTVLPQQCVVYRLVAANQGDTYLYNAVVRDFIPSFTTYLTAAQQCEVQNADPCTFVDPPANGATREPIEVESATVLPSGTITVFFGIKID